MKTNIMKKANLLGAVLLMPALAIYAQNTKVSGNISGLKEPTLLMSRTSGDSAITDTVVVKEGKFTWKAELTGPQKIYMLFPTRLVEFFAEPGNMNIAGSADSLHQLKVTGSKTQDDADAFEASLKDIEEQEMPLYKNWGKGDDKQQAALEAKLNELRMQRRARAEKYVNAHPNSFFSVSLVADRAAMGNYEDVKKMYNLLGPSAQQSIQGKQISDRLVVLHRSSIGQPMLQFTQKNTEGEPVHFSDFKGKYVFVDFWASWCGPCRAENPNVLKAYNKYKDKNFTVLGISLDEDGDKWKKAIQDDKMPWTQVSDLKGWKNDVSTYYGIMGIPSTLLVDPDGNIIAKDLRGAALQQTLAEIFE